MPAIMIDLGQAPPQREERYHAPDAPTDPIDAFRNVLASHGIMPKDIDTSGKLVRVDIEKRGDKAGWYVFFLDTISAGSFGNWRTDLKETWCSIDRKEMSDAESARYAQIVKDSQAQREALKAKLQAKAKATANEIWDKAQDTIAHDYLTKKGVKAHGVRQSKGDLVIPLRDENGDIHNLQFIKADGVKKFLFGGRVDGLSATIPGDSQLAICEGYATGATIHQATKATVICAFNRVNLLPVAKVVRAKCPTENIMICADNDRFTPGNPGLADAGKAAKAISARVIFPVFDGLDGGDDPELKLTDFNDLAAVGGLDIVARQAVAFDASSGKLMPISKSFSRVLGRVKTRPKDREFIFRFNESGLIPRGVVGVLAAEGSTGKTLFLLSLAVAGASGGNFGPINAPRALNVLILLCEDDQDEMDRRLWDITKGKFPERLYGASVYGEMGPIMRLEGSNPVIADAWFWLDQTMANHEDLDLVILDPKSRIYGLDENNNDHGTQWIQALEKLAKKHDLTILFSSHTSKSNAKDISQNMVRGGAAIVDGCRWQGGLIRMDEFTAKKYGIENPREYVMFDAPKSNYASDMPSAICFKRGNHGVLEYCEPGSEIRQEMDGALLEMLSLDTTVYSRNDLKDRPEGVGIARAMKGKFPAFRRRSDMDTIVNNLLRDGKIFEVSCAESGVDKPKKLLKTSPF